jgi:hypothetical protein
MELIEIRLETSRADLDAERSADPDLVEVRGPEPLSRPPHLPALAEARFLEVIAVIVAVTLATLVTRIVNRWLDDRAEGVLIDLRQSPALVSRVAGIPPGFLVLVDQAGEPTTHQARPDNRDSLADVIQAALAGSQ